MKRARLAVWLVVTLAVGVAFATTYRLASPEDMALGADLVFMGTVTSVTAEIRDGRPWTLVQFDDLAILRDQAAEDKGEEPATQLTLSFLGGTVTGEPALLVSGLPTFNQGERWLVLAYQDDQVASPIVGVSQGAWKFGAGGALATDGSYLTVDGSGALVRGTTSPSAEDLWAALSTLLERGAPTAPAPAGSGEQGAAGTAEPQSEPPSETQPGNASGAPAEASAAAPSEVPTETPAETPGETPGVTPPANQSEPTGADDGTAAAGSQGKGAATAAPTPTPAQKPPKVISYRVDDEGGPLLLSSFAAAAAEVWETAAPDTVAFEIDEASSAHIHYGTPELMGTDATSYTLVGPGGLVEVLVSPQVGDELEAVMVHEFGVLLGLPEGGSGIMSRDVSATLAAPTAADIEELRDLRTFVPEDLDRSGSVDFYDLALFGQAYGTSGINLAADFNGDGRVDDADLTLLRDAYEFGPPQEKAPR